MARVPAARLAFYACTLGLFAAVVVSLLRSPPQLIAAGLAIFLYVGFVTVGVLFARLRMFADVLSAGPPGARGVALTFDDGPHPQHTRTILDLLDQFEAKATFFVIGYKAARHRDLVREIHRRGHALGVHSYAHDRLFALRTPWFVRRDLERAIAELEAITGERPRLFRAPIGHISPIMAPVIRELRLQPIGWSVRGLDGVAGATPEQIVARIEPELRDGVIVMLHDAAERDDFEPASVNALGDILRLAARQQLPVVRLDSWAGPGLGPAGLNRG